MFLQTDASNCGIGWCILVPQQILFNCGRYLLSAAAKQDRVEMVKYRKRRIFDILRDPEVRNLMRDRQFMLRPDSENLTFLKVIHREKVKR